MRIPSLRFGLVSVGFCLAAAACAPRQMQPSATLSGEPRLRVAQAAEESGDYGLAESMYAAAAAADPANAAVQLRYADVMVRQGKATQARNFLLQRLSTVSNPQQIRAGLGAIYVLEGNPAGAIAEFDRILAADPGNTRILVNKAVALDLLKRHEEAQALYRKALASAPNDLVVLNDLALSLLLSGQAREAEKVIAPVGAQPDALPRMRANLGVLLAANGDLAGAREIVGADGADDQLAELAKAATGGATR